MKIINYSVLWTWTSKEHEEEEDEKNKMRLSFRFEKWGGIERDAVFGFRIKTSHM
jgi:hypothetical protein